MYKTDRYLPIPWLALFDTHNFSECYAEVLKSPADPKDLRTFQGKDP